MCFLFLCVWVKQIDLGNIRSGYELLVCLGMLNFQVNCYLTWIRSGGSHNYQVEEEKHPCW